MFLPLPLPTQCQAGLWARAVPGAGGGRALQPAPPGVGVAHSEERASGGSVPSGPPGGRTVDYSETKPGTRDATCLRPALAVKEIIGSYNQKV